MSQFHNKVAIVTGAGSGIGLAIAQSLAKAGASVMISDINPSLVNDFVSSGFGQGYAGDMSNMSSIKELVAETIKAFGKIDFLVANAAVTHFASFLEITEEEYDHVADLNQKGTYFLTQQCAKQMKAKGGKIVLISSNISTRAYPKLVAYSMTKAAINMMARSLAAELAPHKININSVAPGPTATDRTIQEVKDYHKVWGDILPTGKPVEVEDIANTVLFLLSDAARQINGQTLFVDGGWNGLGVIPDLN